VAQKNLGYLCKKGKGVKQDYSEASKWCGIARQQRKGLLMPKTT
jgi:TPR repeat protein